MSLAAVLERHRNAGRTFVADGIRSFVLDEGEGAPVVCMHGVPASCFLYRKVLPELARRGLRGVAFDLPGLGEAERRPDIDYTWSGLGRFAIAAVDALGLDRFHLLVHDVGGPVGFEVAAAMPERIASLTMLNTIVEVDRFHRPWTMEPFAWAGFGELWLKSVSVARPLFRRLMFLQGVRDKSAITRDELDAWHALLLQKDRGRAFLRIMRGFERTPEKRATYVRAVRDVPYPVQVLWGADDPALPLRVYGEQARVAAGLDEIHTVRAKHFLQEEQAPAIAERVAAIAGVA